MKPVERSEILDLKAYEAVRDETRRKIIALKEVRRIAVGPHMTLLFENRDLVRYQVHEMTRVERITDEKSIAHELETYNELLPRDGELAATLMIEYVDEVERDRQLTKLMGLETGCLSIRIGGSPAAEAVFDTRQISERRISSVHYVRFPIPEGARRAFRAEGLAGNVRVVVQHPAYEAQAILKPTTVLALAEELS